ncbi:cyclin-domain-containing protein, partial [Absidia repens]
PILSCEDIWSLAELSTSLVSYIWIGPSSKKINTDGFKLFCKKIFKDTQISTCCILLALYYLRQLRSTYPALRATQGSEFRIFTTALILANKYLDDNTFTNKTWSDVSGIPVRELNIMEIEYLTALNYKLHVHCVRFGSWANQCQQWIKP